MIKNIQPNFLLNKYKNILKDKITFKYNADIPLVGLAIHAGHNLRAELKSICSQTDIDRFYEEDIATEKFIEELPVTIVLNDSRYEYDINRDEDTAFYDMYEWGKKVWIENPTPQMRDESIKYYYEVTNFIDDVFSSLIEKHGFCVVYDIHSYNYKRRVDAPSPIFNLGFRSLKGREQYGKKFMDILSNIKLNGEKSDVLADIPFPGGSLGVKLSKKYKNLYFFPTEIKKIYCDEITGELYSDILNEIQVKLTDAMLEMFEYIKHKNN